MRSILLFAGIFILSSLNYSAAQQVIKEISLEDIYTHQKFRERTVRGLRSMNDGEHFTTLEENRKIVKYSYKTGEVVDILFNTIESRSSFYPRKKTENN